MEKEVKNNSSFEKNVYKYVNWGKEWGNDKEDFYFKELYDEVLKRFLSREESNDVRRKGYKYVISLVGYSAQPIIFWHNLVKPVKHFFVCSPETEKTLNRVMEILGHPKTSTWGKRIIQSTNILNIYETINEILNDIGKDNWKNVLIDITGGKKSMAGAASVVGQLLGVDVGYIDYKVYLKDQRKPKPGTEFPIVLANPLKVFGYIEINRAKAFFNSNHFERANEILESLHGETRSQNEVEKYEYINDIYKSWNDFDIYGAINKIKEFMEKVESDIYPLDSSVKRTIFNHFTLLENIKKGFDDDSSYEFYVPLNFYFAAERYSGTRKFDIAVFLMYRVLESIEQVRLKKRGINPSNATRKQYEKSGLSFDGYKRVAGAVYNNFSPSNGLPKKIALMGGFISLAAVKDEIFAGMNEDAINALLREVYGVTQLRNNSIYTHGFTPLKEEDYTKIRRVARKVLNFFLQKEVGKTFNSFEKDFSFLKL